MEFERHDRSSRWQRRSSVPKLLKRPPRPYPCTKVALCQALERAVLVSAEFAAAATGGESRLEPLGRHALRGVREPKEIFALDLGAGS